MKSKIIIFICIVLVGGGCKKKEQRDPVVYVINKLARIRPQNPIVQKKANAALLKWNDKKIDGCPILIIAHLASDKSQINIGIYDEDRDILGIVIREEQTLSDGNRTEKEEDYPVFAHKPISDVANLYSIPIKIKTTNQQKDEQAWSSYLVMDYEQEAKEYLLSKETKNKYGFGPCSVSDFIDSYLVWEYLLPTVWISGAEPNKVDVSVWVYDKAGNKSESAKLLNRI